MVTAGFLRHLILAELVEPTFESNTLDGLTGSPVGKGNFSPLAFTKRPPLLAFLAPRAGFLASLLLVALPPTTSTITIYNSANGPPQWPPSYMRTTRNTLQVLSRLFGCNARPYYITCAECAESGV